MRYKILPVKPGIKYAASYKSRIDAARRIAAGMLSEKVFDPLRPDYVEIWQTDAEPRRGRKSAWVFVERVSVKAETIL